MTLNPEKETDEFVDSIIKSVRCWVLIMVIICITRVIILILSLNALKHSFGIISYVDSQNSEQIRENRGTLTQTGLTQSLETECRREHGNFRENENRLFQAESTY